MGTSPTSGTTLQRPDLGELAYEYMLSPSTMGLMGLDILPIFEVDEKSADYPVIPQEAVLKVQEVMRADRGNYPRSDWQFETKTYACEERGWEELVGDDEWKNYSRFFDLQQESMARAMFVILLAQEVDIATLIFDTSTFSGATSSVTTEWSTAASATPRADINTAKQAMLIQPDSLAISYKVFLNLVNTDEVKDALKYTNPIEMGGLEAQRAMVAQYLGLDNVFVSNAKKDTKKKGVSASVSDVWDDEYALVFKRAEGASMRNPALGRTFLWTPDSPNVLTTEEYREDQTRSNVYRVRHNADEVVQFATGCGYLLQNITA
jgi:hypothetical protein